MALFPAYAPSTGEKPPSTSLPNDSFRFSSFQLPPEKEADKDVVILDEKSEDEVKIIHEKSCSPLSDKPKRRRDRKRRKEKRKRRRRSSSSAGGSENEVSTKRSGKGSLTSAYPSSSTVKWTLLKESDIKSAFGEQKLFIFDNRRDIENLRYDTVYKANLAKFGNRMNQCFGNTSQRIDRLFFGQTPSGSNLKNRRYFSRRMRRAFDSNTGSVSLAAKPTNGEHLASVETLPEFLPVDNTMIVDGKTLIYDPKFQMYRPVDDSANDVSDVDVAITSSADAGLIGENKRLNRLVMENPHNVELWKEFLRLQDRLFFSGDTKRKEKETPYSNLALLERKLSVLEKAIEKNSANVELKMLRLHVGRESGWDHNRLRDEWRRLEFTHVNDPDVWIGRLEFERGGEFSKFIFSRQNALYDHCLERFSTVLSGQLVTHPPPENGEAYLVDFLMAKVVFLFDSGYTEQAFACIQALLEFNFKPPPTFVALPPSEKRHYFEPFWDSNQPRLGENGAAGWAETTKRTIKPVEETAESSTDEDDVCKRGVSMRDAGLWLELERLRESKHWLPWRSVEEPEDAQRVVLFDDIVGVLHEIKGTQNRFRMVVKILTICGMDLPSLDSSNQHVWYDEKGSLDALEHLQLLPQLRRARFIGSDQFLERQCFEVLQLFPASCVYRTYVICGWLHHKAISLSKSDTSNKEKLKLYKKVAMKVLEDDEWRDSVVCYQAYAFGLKTLGALKEAADVAETALNATNAAPNVIDYVSVLNLMCIWIDCKFAQSGEMGFIAEKLSNWILNLVRNSTTENSDSFSPSRLLKVKNYLASRVVDWKEKPLQTEETFLASWIGSVGSLLSHLAATFNYACVQDLHESRRHYVETRQFLKNMITGTNSNQFEADIERLWVWEVGLVDYSLRSNPASSPRIFTQCLEEALREFPANSYFLKLYIDGHLRGQLVAKLRRFFDHRHENWHQNGRNCMQISWIAAVYSEFARYVKLKDEQTDDVLASSFVPETKRLQNVLARAVEACPNSVLLWRLKLTLESYLGERTSVKRTFYLAIRQCPWAKDLYMDAVALLPDEGQSIVDLMVEKGLRVRVPWEELLLLRKAVDRDQQEPTAPVLIE